MHFSPKLFATTNSGRLSASVKRISQNHRGEKVGPLTNDFPRALTRFETEKIQRQLLTDLHEKIAPRQIFSTENATALDDRASLCLQNLDTWPVPTGLRVLHDLLTAGSLSKDALVGDIRFLRFMGQRASSAILNVEQKFLLLDLFSHFPNDRINSLIEEIVTEHELEGLGETEIVRLAEIAVNHSGVSFQMLDFLTQYSDGFGSIQLYLTLLPYRLQKGELGISDNLLEILSVADTIQVLNALCTCQFPDLISRTIRLVADSLTRLTFYRLTSSEEKAQIQTALFKLKIKLDAMVHVEGNPFYDKSGRKKNFLAKILRSLSSCFEESAATVSLSIASKQMLELIGLNALSANGVDAIAHRIEAFGAESGLDSASFTNLVWALTHNPHKRQDKFRMLIGTQLAAGMHAHLPTMTTKQILICTFALMRIHNSPIRAVVDYGFRKYAKLGEISDSEKVSLISVYSVLLKKNRKLSSEPVISLLDSLNLAKLSMPQLVSVFGSVVKTNSSMAGDLVLAIQTRLANGGSISPSNTVRMIEYLAQSVETCENDSLTLVKTLIQALPPVDSPILAAKLVTHICSFGDQGLLLQANSLIEDALVLLAVPEHMEQVCEENPRLGAAFEASLPLLGDAGSKFQLHMQEIQLLE